jgi:starvation-inducible DNA-binding protein
MAETKQKSETKEKFVRTSIDIQQESRTKMVEMLNIHLADTFDLFSHTKQAHWNVKGREFMQLHELYDELAEILLKFVDMLAERATALGGIAHGTVRMAAKASRLPDYPDGPIGSVESVEALVERYAELAASVRAAIDEAEEAEDMSTSDLMTEFSRELDKALWFLEAHLQDRAQS